MAKMKYHINLSEQERNTLTQIVCDGAGSEREVMRAKILLMSEATHKEKTSIRELAEWLGTTETTIETVRSEYAKKGALATVYRNERKTYGHYGRINEDVVRGIQNLANEPPPIGHKKWSGRMLCKEAMERGIIDSISLATVLRIVNSEEKNTL